MEISNIRIEEKDSRSYLIADVECGFSDSKKLWFSVDSKYRNWLTADVYDAFLVASIYPAMYYGENIKIRGSVSKKIYKNLTEYIMPVIKALHNEFHVISVDVNAFDNAKKSGDNRVGTGFSGGVDSFSTIVDKFELENDQEYKINTLFFFNIGQYQDFEKKPDVKRAVEYYENAIVLTKELGLPYIFLDTNLFDFYLPKWEYDAGPLCRITSILVFQRALIRYYVSGSLHYIQQNTYKKKDLDDVADTFIYYMLSPDNLEIVLDGNQYFRYEKIEKISDYEYVRRNLNVCINRSIDIVKDKNCGKCNKCLRTLIVLEAAGRLNDFNQVFNIEAYRRNSYYNKCKTVIGVQKSEFYANENFDYARSHGLKMPSLLIARCFILSRRLISKIKRLINR